MDAATKIYEGILADGEPGLQRMKLNREPESNLLDFKRAKDQSAPLRQDDRTHLAKSIGGFANSDGGVLVWGVDARVQNGIDGVCELYPIKKLKAFKSELENLTPKYVYPVPDGIIHTPIYPDENKDEGYILTLVPAYDGLPVRSTIKDQGSDFFVRAGDQFTAMSHSHLADRFGRRPQPKLSLSGYLEIIAETRERSLLLFVTNLGKGLAQKMNVIVNCDLPGQTSGWQHDGDVRFSSHLHLSPGICFYGHPDEVLHPGLSTKIYAAFEHNMGGAFINKLKEGAEIPYRVSCDGFVHSGAIKLSLNRIETGNKIRYEFSEVKNDRHRLDKSAST